MWQRAQLLKQKVNEIAKSEGTDVVLVVTHYVMINALKEPQGEIDQSANKYKNESYIEPNSITLINVWTGACILALNLAINEQNLK